MTTDLQHLGRISGYYGKQIPSKESGKSPVLCNLPVRKSTVECDLKLRNLNLNCTVDKVDCVCLQEFVDLNAVGVDFGEEDEMGGFDYHKLTEDQLKRMYYVQSSNIRKIYRAVAH